mmetsp:Transcript_3269/g.5096  ORF Transcript_3269/g.5096 Transcript_3269/m.5096 type:complete len:408 (+) Transcript_3269:269-1492(+)|eukprot:CAMPEP_0185019618 /NCGR_PEP_ID=MMETSP1103-20130426/2232_1 /TAXON_ID=36769 /ORGANISM="Paraphysomonas bandaiensis, Strain Caron Lab Isolate" /LENGTH=407 /DNA_ID=CAMNT_0027550041 /DNA_START=213 /DNA_END=1436 /DNA_ORIENTATION=-
MSLFGIVKLMMQNGEDSENETDTDAAHRNHCDHDTVPAKIENEEVNNEPTVCAGSPDNEQSVCSREGSQENIGEQDSAGSKVTKSKKKRAKKKLRRRANSVVSTDSAHNMKHVQWGKVEEVLFSRDMGLHTVPNSGLYPLALGEECERRENSIDEHESSKQMELLQRALEYGIDLSDIGGLNAGEYEDADDGEATTRYRPLETRQYDYRRGSNPLFRPLPEPERVVLLGNLSRQSASDGDGTSVGAINKDLTHVRHSRNAVGCSCKAVKLDKLSVTKMRQELIQYTARISASVTDETNEEDASDKEKAAATLSPDMIQCMTKSELTQRLREALSSCPLCVANNCACVAAGIPCHANVCGCFRYNTKQVCKNPYGADDYHPDKVHEYRQQFVSPENSKLTRPSRANTT